MPADRLSATFSALSDPTRRAILARLASGEASVTELAAPFAMTLPAVSKHLKVLRNAGLIERGRAAQWRPCRLQGEGMREAATWLEQYRRFWDASFDRLDAYLAEIQAKETPMTVATMPPVVIERTIAAARARVFEVWTTAGHMARWFGPNGFTVPECTVDFRVGGQFLLTMRGPDGTDYPCRGVYHEIAAPERIVFTSSALDAAGASLFDVRTVVTFADAGAHTTVRVEATVVAIHDPIAPTYISGMKEGWAQTVARMAAHAEGAAR